jgi:tetratricopeptide (TPR) repeat protein
MDQQKYSDAARELRAALALDTQIRGANYQLGLALFETGRFAEAQSAFTKELDFLPPDPFSLYYLGRISLQERRTRQAVSYFEKSLQAGEVLDVRQKLANLYLSQSQIDGAIRFLEESVRLRPEVGALHFLLGRAYQRKGSTAASRREFDAANRWMAKVRTDMAALTRLDQSLRENKQTEVAEVIRELGNSGDADVLLAAATSLGREGLHREAAVFLERAIALKPDFAEAHYNLGRAYTALNDPAKAREQLTIAAKLQPGFYEAETLLGALLAASGENEQAIPHLRAAVQIRSDSPRILMMLGLEYLQQRYFSDAIDVLKKSLQLDPTNPEPRFLLIQAHYRNLEYESALNLARETLKLFPDNPLSHYHLGAQLNNFGRLEESRKELEIALAGNSKLVEASIMLGDVLFKMGEPAASIAQFRQALTEDSTQAEAHAGLGKALIQLKRYPETVAAMEEAIRIDGKLPALHLYLSQAYRAVGRLNDARKESEIFTRLNAERAKARDKDVERKYM